MMKHRTALSASRWPTAGLMWCNAMLTGCSHLSPAPPPPQPAPQPLPAARQIIANSTDVLFDVATNPRNVAISELRRFDTVLGSQFGVCLRATVSDRGGKRRIATYVVFVSNDRVSDRRRATPADECDRETYQPL